MLSSFLKLLYLVIILFSNVVDFPLYSITKSSQKKNWMVRFIVAIKTNISAEFPINLSIMIIPVLKSGCKSRIKKRKIKMVKYNENLKVEMFNNLTFLCRYSLLNNSDK